MADMIATAVSAYLTHDLDSYDMWIDHIVASDRGKGERGNELSSELEGQMSLALRRLWRSGWQPADVCSVVRRLDSPSHAIVAAAAIASDAVLDNDVPMHPVWVSQLEELGAWWGQRHDLRNGWLALVVNAMGLSVRTVVEQAMEVLARLTYLPVLPTLIPPPGPGAAASRASDGSQSIDGKMLARIRALLAKAESTYFVEEAEAFTEKAQQLMTRYSIDVAMLAASNHGASAGAAAVRIHLDPPYIDAKSSLVNAVARANRCRVVLQSDFGFVTVFGFPTDLAVVDMLFTSLLAQATHAMVIAGRLINEAGVTRTRSFRSTFLVAFASRIGERLAEVVHASASEAEAEFGTALVLMLNQREAEVDEAVTQAFPKMKTVRPRMSNAAGWHAGRAAGDKASLNSGTAIRRPRKSA